MDKQIKEIAKVLDECCNFYDRNGVHLGNKCNSYDCEYWCDTNGLCCSYNKKEATALYNAGYRKIPENAVVFIPTEEKHAILSQEEYSNYLILQQNHEWLREEAKRLQEDNERLYKNLGKFKDSVRKETAREIADWLDNEKGYCGLGYLVKKQFGVEIEE